MYSQRYFKELLGLEIGYEYGGFGFMSTYPYRK